MDSLILSQAHRPTPEIASLLAAHFEMMRATSPAESCHVMPPDAVFEQADLVLVARSGVQLLGIGAFKSIDPHHAELKSMHTAAAARGRGVGRLILQGLMARAHSAGHTRMSLETGSMEAFAPARALYLAEGFETCAPFGDYACDPLSTFMTRSL